MPRLIFHGINPSQWESNWAILRLEGRRMIDGDRVLAEYTGTFWKNREGDFTGIEIWGVKSISILCQSGTERIFLPQFDVSIAGNTLWNGKESIATLIDSQWSECSTGDSASEILLQGPTDEKRLRRDC